MDDSANVQNRIIVTLSSVEKYYPFDQLSVNFDSSDEEILNALRPVLLEDEGFDIQEAQEDGYYTIKKVESSQNIYVFPKSTAG